MWWKVYKTSCGFSHEKLHKISTKNGEFLNEYYEFNKRILRVNFFFDITMLSKLYVAKYEWEWD